MRPSYILTQFEVYMLTPEIVRFVRSCCLHFEENDYCVVRPAARCVRQSTEAVAENPPSIRHQNLAIFELFSRHSGAEKPDEKRVLLIALALFISAGFAQENKANREVVLTQRRAATHWPSLAHIRRRLKRVAEQVDHYRKKQPAFFGRDIRQITNPRLVGRGHDELAIEHIRRDRQVVPAVGGGNAESPLAASLNAVLLHQPLHPQLANANALRPQLPPDARPSIRSATLRIDGADVN